MASELYHIGLPTLAEANSKDKVQFLAGRGITSYATCRAPRSKGGITPWSDRAIFGDVNVANYAATAAASTTAPASLSSLKKNVEPKTKSLRKCTFQISPPDRSSETPEDNIIHSRKTQEAGKMKEERRVAYAKRRNARRKLATRVALSERELELYLCHPSIGAARRIKIEMARLPMITTKKMGWISKGYCGIWIPIEDDHDSRR
ncbi:hypothetical protein BGAL_0228g00170 [Botrytis galanthina]|uniref:Uncharacterized protein n=1 Tax=Botrytis galanthina TaxID=278940 RepID=A0A4S8QU19_9HELO|nr:hypothetical protein BGAL_0228g00170 [Botrytis galanthina]